MSRRLTTRELKVQAVFLAALHAIQDRKAFAEHRMNSIRFAETVERTIGDALTAVYPAPVEMTFLQWTRSFFDHNGVEYELRREMERRVRHAEGSAKLAIMAIAESLETSYGHIESMLADIEELWKASRTFLDRAGFLADAVADNMGPNEAGDRQIETKISGACEDAMKEADNAFRTMLKKIDRLAAFPEFLPENRARLCATYP